MLPRNHITNILKWLSIGASVGVMGGIASAVFLKALEVVTDYRLDHPKLVYTLPAAGLILGLFYEKFGKSIAAGSNLVIDTMHDRGGRIPFRMTPMVLVGTVLTHLFGGSAGREGTAIQMGASLADNWAGVFKNGQQLRQHFLAAGVAGGFGSVFGTPIAATIFALEFVSIGAIEYTCLVAALTASVVGDMVTRKLGIIHTIYPKAPHLDLDPVVLGKWIIFAISVALVGSIFIELVHTVKRFATQLFPRLPIRMAVGGTLVVILWTCSGTSEYLGLGTSGILRAFSESSVPIFAFAYKTVFTAITLGSGFLGGEVTPLFFVGASLGNVLAQYLNVPNALGAGIGMAAVFASASNTPLSLSVMAVELLGRDILPHVVIVCVIAYYLVGHRSIYPSQRATKDKSGALLNAATSLRDWQSKRRP